MKSFKQENKHNRKAHFWFCFSCSQVQVLSETAVCEDLWELLEEVEGERLLLKRSRTSFSLDEFNCASEPEIGHCCRERGKLRNIRGVAVDQCFLFCNI